MLLVIHPTIADVKSSEEADVLIDDYHFFVVAPQERNQDKVWMPEDPNVAMERLQIGLRIFGIVVESQFGLQKQNDVNFDPSLGNSSEHVVQSCFAFQTVGTKQQEERSEHPVGYEHFLLGVEQLGMNITKVIFTVDVELALAVFALASKASKSIDFKVVVFREGKLHRTNEQHKGKEIVGEEL